MQKRLCHQVELRGGGGTPVSVRVFLAQRSGAQERLAANIGVMKTTITGLSCVVMVVHCMLIHLNHLSRDVNGAWRDHPRPCWLPIHRCGFLSSSANDPECVLEALRPSGKLRTHLLLERPPKRKTYVRKNLPGWMAGKQSIYPEQHKTQTGTIVDTPAEVKRSIVINREKANLQVSRQARRYAACMPRSMLFGMYNN